VESVLGPSEDLFGLAFTLPILPYRRIGELRRIFCCRPCPHLRGVPTIYSTMVLYDIALYDIRPKPSFSLLQTNKVPVPHKVETQYIAIANCAT